MIGPVRRQHALWHGIHWHLHGGHGWLFLPRSIPRAATHEGMEWGGARKCAARSMGLAWRLPSHAHLAAGRHPVAAGSAAHPEHEARSKAEQQPPHPPPCPQATSKIIAWGFKTYISVLTNQIDFLIVVTSLLELALRNLPWFHALRCKGGRLESRGL